ncbi:MAG: hypothetical protein K0R71_153 [Bacillales bacterium]|jgi:hypothetical protein|nr:hypothetical protein [Bacillales bacterium]
MRSKFLLCIILFSFITLIGCSKIEDTLSEEKAKQLVIEEHTKHIGTPSILYIEVKNNAYYVEWENRENKESGTDKVTKNGEVIMVEARIE